MELKPPFLDQRRGVAKPSVLVWLRSYRVAELSILNLLPHHPQPFRQEAGNFFNTLFW